MKWIKTDAILIERLAMHRWTEDNPAPFDLAVIFAAGRFASGGKISVRQLATFMGWKSKNKAVEAIKEARDQVKSLYEPGKDSGRDSGRDSADLQYQHLTPQAGTVLGQKEDTFGTPYVRAVPLRADKEQINKEPIHVAEATLTAGKADSRDYSLEGRSFAVSPPQTGLVAPEPNATPVETPVKAPRLSYKAFWKAMEGIRLANVPNARETKIGARNQVVAARVKEHGEEALIHAWRWVHESSHQRATYLRNHCHATYGTFFAASKCRQYVGFASEWDRESEQRSAARPDIFDLGDGDGDDSGNIIDFRNSKQGNSNNAHINVNFLLASNSCKGIFL